MTRAALRRVIVELRSGNPWMMKHAEETLLREAGLLTPGCACPNFPSERSPKCFAHMWIADALMRGERRTEAEIERDLGPWPEPTYATGHAATDRRRTQPSHGQAVDP